MTGAGDLDRRIQLQSAATANDADTNEAIETWSTYATVWAEVRYLNEGERVSPEKWFAEQIATFRVRWRSDIDPRHRIVFDGNTFEIRGKPREIGRHVFLDIPVKLIE